jgi:ribonuclease HI
LAAPVAARFAARPVVALLDELADALGWPRSRPARVLAGERAALAARVVICADEGALAALEAPADAIVLLATPPSTSDGRLGRRAYDPFAGNADDPSSWHRTERVVLDASLLLSGGRGGIDERVAQQLGLQPPHGHAVAPPVRSVPRDVCKLVGYVPTDALEQVREAVFAAGAGTIGAYDRCSWSVSGTGTFRGGEHTNPTIGTRGEFERVEEERFEVVVPRAFVDRACRAFIAAHPYEEPAFDVVPLAIPAQVGFGRLGVLGTGGGAAAWSSLGELDHELEAYGAVDKVAAGSPCVVYGGPLRDVLDAVLDEPELALAVVGSATELELDLLAARDVAVLVLDRTRAVDAFATELAGLLSRALTLPVTAMASLHFPEETHLPSDTSDDQLPDSTHVADAAASVFDAGTPPGSDPFYATGTWRLHFDGGSRGNPGPAAYGWVLYGPDGEEHEADGVKIGSATNNVAEWTGLLRGLEHALARGIRTLSVRGDSELVVKQVTGVYKVKNAALKPLAEEVAALIRRFDRVDVKHVYRADNARADAVANEAMDGLR